MTTRRADFSRVLVGLEPVIQLPRDRAPVRCLGFDFYQETSQREPSRFFLPTKEAIEWPDMHAPSLRNPLLPVWDPWPGELHQVPYPAEDRTMLLTLDWSGVVEATWETIPTFRDPRDVAMERNFLASVGTWPESLASVAARYTRQYFDALGHVVEVESPSRYPSHPWLTPRVDARTPVPVAGDEQSHVPEETIATLVELARQNRYRDFVDLAGAVGVGKAEWDALWRGTRARVGATVEELDPPF